MATAAVAAAAAAARGTGRPQRSGSGAARGSSRASGGRSSAGRTDPLAAATLRRAPASHTIRLRVWATRTAATHATLGRITCLSLISSNCRRRGFAIRTTAPRRRPTASTTQGTAFLRVGTFMVRVVTALRRACTIHLLLLVTCTVVHSAVRTSSHPHHLEPMNHRLSTTTSRSAIHPTATLPDHRLLRTRHPATLRDLRRRLTTRRHRLRTRRLDIRQLPTIHRLRRTRTEGHRNISHRLTSCRRRRTCTEDHRLSGRPLIICHRPPHRLRSSLGTTLSRSSAEESSCMTATPTRPRAARAW
mmetsp:Transcript_20639/g.57576  ORF Transcript_20639/g.57576 Transcript_20639/m.57576 type:complete len:303 (+) Transcript_20639:153-1061(+)